MRALSPLRAPLHVPLHVPLCALLRRVAAPKSRI